MLDPKLFAVRLRRFRSMTGMTLQKVSDKSGIAMGTITEAERNPKNIGWQTLSKILEAEGYTMADFFAEDDPKKGKKKYYVVEASSPDEAIKKLRTGNTREE